MLASIKEQEDDLTILDMQTMISMDDDVWEKLKIISQKEGMSLPMLCKYISNKKEDEQSLSDAIKSFAEGYNRFSNA